MIRVWCVWGSFFSRYEGRGCARCFDRRSVRRPERGDGMFRVCGARLVVGWRSLTSRPFSRRALDGAGDRNQAVPWERFSQRVRKPRERNELVRADGVEVVWSLNRRGREAVAEAGRPTAVPAGRAVSSRDESERAGARCSGCHDGTRAPLPTCAQMLGPVISARPLLAVARVVRAAG